MRFVLFLLVFLPILAAPVAFFLGRRSARLRDWTVVAASLITLCLSILPHFFPASLSLPGFCGIGAHFRTDGLRALLSTLAAVVFLGSVGLGLSYFAHDAHAGRYQLFMLLTMGAVQGVFLSDDLFTLFLFFEMMSFTSYAFVKQEETPDALRAGQTYLAVSVVAGLVSLFGLFLLYRQVGVCDFASLSALDPNALMLPGCLILTGFAAKAGLFPLHVWLPEAHPAAPAPASALLSCILTKTGVFGALVLTGKLFLTSETWGMLLLILGAITMVLGAVLALLSANLKRTLACSSLSQIGFIAVGMACLCLVPQEVQLPATGLLCHVINHALIKVVLFGAAGVVAHNLHALDLNDIEGYGRDKPALMIPFLLAALSIAGVPGFSGYASKTLLHEGLLAYEGARVALVRIVEYAFLFSGGLTLAYMLKLFVALFVERGPAREKTPYMSRGTAITLWGFALALTVFGVWPNETLLPLVRSAMPFFGAEPMHRVAFFSGANLDGALISIGIGLAVYFVFDRTSTLMLGRYVGRPSPAHTLENLAYRPLLTRYLPFVLSPVAEVLSGATEWVIRFFRKTVFGAWDRRRDPRTDEQFAVYPEEPFVLRGFPDTLAFSFLLLGIGLVTVLLYLLFA